MSQDQVITSRDGELSDMVMEAIGTNTVSYTHLLRRKCPGLKRATETKEPKGW